MSRDRDRDRLGLDRTITRRDFFLGSVGLAGASALSGCREEAATPPPELAALESESFDVGEAWYGPGGVGDYAASHGNTPELLRVAHRVREGLYDEAAADAVETGESYDLVVVGGGLAGLAAAHHFRRLRPDGRVLVLDNHPIFGGEAKRNEFLVDGQRLYGPQGSNDFGVLPETGGPEDYFTALGMPREFHYAEPAGAAEGMRVPLDHYSYLHWKEAAFDVGHFLGGSGLLDGEGGWTLDLWRSGTWDPALGGAVEKWRSASAEDNAPGDAELGPWLDRMTVKAYYERVLGLPPSITAYVDPILASIIGLGCDAISAWWGWHFQLPGFRTSSRYDDAVFHCFPGGNTGIARYFVKSLVPGAIRGGFALPEVIEGKVDFDALDRDGSPVRLRGGATVVRVEHETDSRVAITFVKNGRVHRLVAPAVVMASGGWMNRRVIRDLPEPHRRAYESFRHSSVLVVNVALRHWRFLAKLGIAAAIWEGGFGFAANIRRPMRLSASGEVPRFDPDTPTVMTFYVPLFTPGIPAMNQGQAGRLELLQTPFAEYERRLKEQMLLLFGGASFDPANDVAGIILNRWGHAYINPEPGFQFGVEGAEPVHEGIRKPFGRVAIGHSELRGHQNWTGAAAEGRRAVEALFDGRS